MASYLYRNSPVPTSEKKFTFSTWFKLCSASGSDNGIVEWYKSSNERYQILIDSATRQLRLYAVEGGTVKANIYTDMAFRDTNGWYNVCIHSDTTQSNSSDRFKLWVNGVAQTFASYTWSYSQNANVNVFDGSSTRLNLGVRNETFSNFINGYLADTYYIDGSLIDYTQFGSTDSVTGEWKPKLDPTISSFGNAGIHLKYENSSNIGLDSSGNTNNFTASGTVTQSQDNPSNVFATMNPLAMGTASSNHTFSDGNLTSTNSSSSHRSVVSSLAVSSGKWYFEGKSVSTGGAYPTFGIFNADAPFDAGTYFTSTANGYGYNSNGAIFNNANSIVTGLDTWTDGDIIGVALDATNNKIYFSKNGSWQNSADPSAGTGGQSITSDITWYFAGHTNDAGTNPVQNYNFGNGYFGTTAITSEGTNASGIGKFEYDVPTGYTALSTKGLNT